MYKYVNLKDKNNLGLLGIAYKNDNKNGYMRCNRIDFSAVFYHDNYFSITNNSLNLSKNYGDNEIINNIIDNMNKGLFDMDGTSLAGTKEQILSELNKVSGLNINL